LHRNNLKPRQSPKLSYFCPVNIFDKINRQFLNPELQFQASRSSGPGGQNVNKVNTRMVLIFHVFDSAILSDIQKELLKTKLANKIDSEGKIQIQAQEKRTQTQNKEVAIKKFYAMLAKAFIKIAPRLATKPGKAAIEKRLTGKRKQAERKNARSGNYDD